MFLEERLDRLHVHPVVGVRVPFKCWCVKVGVPEICRDRILLVLLVVMCHSRELPTLPRVVADVEGVVQRAKEEHAVCDK